MEALNVNIPATSRRFPLLQMYLEMFFHRVGYKFMPYLYQEGNCLYFNYFEGRDQILFPKAQSYRFYVL